MRLDQFLVKSFPEHSRAFWQKMIGDHNVLINGHPYKVHQKVSKDDEIRIIWPEKKPEEKSLPSSPLEVLYEDLDLIVVNKPSGIVVHPALGHATGTLIEQVADHCGFVPSDFADTIRPGLIHRLDKETSGALLIAKNVVSQNHLARNLAERKFEKFYLTLVIGKLKHSEGLIDAPLGRSLNNRQKMVIRSGSDTKYAQTKYKVLESVKFEKTTLSLIEAQILTGRTHQIRVHFASLGHPVLGDGKYGRKKINEIAKEKLGLSRQFLHAWKLNFPHPEKNETMKIVAPVPKELKNILDKLKLKITN